MCITPPGSDCHVKFQFWRQLSETVTTAVPTTSANTFCTTNFGLEYMKAHQMTMKGLCKAMHWMPKQQASQQADRLSASVASSGSISKRFGHILIELSVTQYSFLIFRNVLFSYEFSFGALKLRATTYKLLSINQ